MNTITEKNGDTYTFEVTSSVSQTIQKTEAELQARKTELEEKITRIELRKVQLQDDLDIVDELLTLISNYP